MNSKRIAIVVAGGTGTRMGAEVPKQFLLLQGEPILMHTIRVFGGIQLVDEIILVLPESLKAGEHASSPLAMGWRRLQI
jgi:2-C-methyl-D-erythritol 4-phosphate cytidylyltransferase